MLTDAQRALVERYHGVIYAALAKYHMSANNYYDVAAERLCRAAQSFQGDPNNFFSYAFTSIHHALMDTAHHKHPHPADIDRIPVAAPDAFAESEDKQYQSDVINVCKQFMTPAELQAIQRVMIGEKSRSRAESEARDRALKKCRAYLRGEDVKIYCGAGLTPEQRAVRDKKIVELRAHGYNFLTVADMCNVSGRLVRQIYAAAGKPQYRTSADYARMYGVDRSTIVRHAQGYKIGRFWQINSAKIHKPYAQYSDCYTAKEIEAINVHPHLPDAELAKLIGRSANAVHIKRWRMSKAPG